LAGDTSLPLEAALAKVDALTAQAVGWAAPIQFRVADTETERLAAYRLRYLAVVEHGWMQPEELPDGLERDGYDAEAIQIVGWDGEIPAATCRIILPGRHLRLPTEEAFDLQIEPRGRVVDAGRFVVARAYTATDHRALGALVASFWQVIRGHGYYRACAAFASTAMLRVYARMGLRAQVLGPARRYWGIERYPVLFNGAASTRDLMARWTAEPGAPAR
jgi:N-acyl-L-homoserine lactone synthetase